MILFSLIFKSDVLSPQSETINTKILFFLLTLSQLERCWSFDVLDDIFGIDERLYFGDFGLVAWLAIQHVEFIDDRFVVGIEKVMRNLVY